MGGRVRGGEGGGGVSLRGPKRGGEYPPREPAVQYATLCQLHFNQSTPITHAAGTRVCTASLHPCLIMPDLRRYSTWQVQ